MTVEPDGFTVTVRPADGKVETHRWERVLPDTPFSRALIRGFAERVDPVRTLQSRQSRISARKRLRPFAKWVGEVQPPIREPADFTPGRYEEWREHLRDTETKATHGIACEVRQILLQTPGLPEETVADLKSKSPTLPSKQPLTARPQQQPGPPYTKPVLEAYMSYSREVLRRGHQRVTQNMRLVSQLRDGSHALEGDARVTAERLHSILAGEQPDERWELTLTRHEAQAAVVLCMGGAGVNLSAATTLRVLEHNPTAGDRVRTYVVTAYKARRPPATRHMAVTLEGPDEWAGSQQFTRTLIEATQPGRDILATQGTPTDILLIFSVAKTQHRALDTTVATHSNLALNFGTQWRQDSLRNKDLPFWFDGCENLIPTNVRKAFVRLTQKEAMHTERTRDDVYLLRDPLVAAEMEPVITAGLTAAHDDALRFAAALRLVDHDTADTATLTKGDLERILAGRLDTVVGACTDFEHEPTTGEPCQRSFLGCLDCSNAVVTRRHLPLLVAAHDGLENLRSEMPSRTWALTLRRPYSILSSFLALHVSAEDRIALAGTLTEHQRGLLHALFRRQLEA